MTRVFDPQHQSTRYASLGLIANPFFGVEMTDDLGICCEVASESNQLLQAIVSAVAEEKPRPIWVTKAGAIPGSYALAADSRVEQSIGTDEDLNTLHGYIPLFGMRDGAIRSIITLLGERLVWRDFDRTLVAYVERVLAEPDEGLASYQVMGPDALAVFSDAFSSNPIGTVHATLGEPVEERIEEMNMIADMRQLDFVGDGAETAEEDCDEIDETVRDAAGLDVLTEQEAGEAGPDLYSEVADYIIEYAGVHMSPVVGRAFRVFRGRGLAAAAREFNITQAPRKTLLAIVKLARVRYEKIVLIWDGFENWLQIEPGLRSKIVGLLLETRWALDGDAVLVFLIDENAAPEMEESFSSGAKLTWAFPGLEPMEEAPDELIPGVVERWLANATMPGSKTITLADVGMAALVEASGGSMDRFVRLGLEAIEDAADRKADTIDEVAVQAAVNAVENAALEAEQD